MEYESPIKDTATSFTVPIKTTKYLEVKYSSAVSGSYTTPPPDLFAFMTYIADMASLYEEYSKKWFNREMLSIFFIKTTQHDWNHMSHSPYISPPKYESVPVDVHQTWCPVKITVQLNKYTIHWILLDKAYNNPTPEETVIPKSEEVPYSKNQILMVLKKTPRSEHHRKIRKARLLLAATKVKLNSLVLRYIEKYGELDNSSDTDSVLSYGSEDN